MPRAETSVAGRTLGFFRTAPLDVAELIVQLAKDVVTERKRAAQAAVLPAAGAVAAPVAAPKKKKSHKRKTAATPPAQPADGSADAGYEAGDAPPA